MKKNILIYFLLCLFFGNLSYAKSEHFIDPNARYQQIVSSLRCLVCQNQSIADSHADIAKDIRVKVVELIKLGYSNSKIIHFFIKRYGEYIYYRPTIDYRTYVLWYGPFVIFLIGLFFLLRRVS